MCEKRNLTFRNTLHLTLSDRTHFTECRCWVNQGTFTMLFNDIRLTQKAGSKCSPAELVIGDNHLSCNGNKKEGFGSVFKEKNQDVTSLGVYVSLSSKSEDISPDMVWLIFHPHGKFCLWKIPILELKTTKGRQIPYMAVLCYKIV